MVLGPAASSADVSGSMSRSWWKLLCLCVSEHGTSCSAGSEELSPWCVGFLILALTLRGVADSLDWEETGLSFFLCARAGHLAQEEEN